VTEAQATALLAQMTQVENRLDALGTLLGKGVLILEAVAVLIAVAVFVQVALRRVSS
jgi:hypothetical protein